MSLIDIVILIITLVIVGLVIYFSFIKPHISGVPRQCSSCPVNKKGKRLVKDYKKSKQQSK